MEAGSNVCVRKGQNSENGVTFFTPLSLFFTSRLFLLAKKTSWVSQAKAGVLNPIVIGFIFLFLFPVSQLYAQSTQTYTASGSFTVPAGVTSITVECWGAGGGGSTITSSGRRGGGGGGGAFASRTLSPVIPGTVYNFTVGAGGAASAAGGNTVFLTGIIAAAGGTGGVYNSTTAGVGGAAGASFGSTRWSGGNGANGGGTNSGGGGGGAGTTAAGGNAAGATGGAGGFALGGDGGDGVWGSANGNPGSTYGGGGSGAVTNSGTDRNGGIGAGGAIRISWTCPTYSLTSTSATSVCVNNSSTVTLASTAAGLPVGTYTVTYNLTGANTVAGATATMTVTTAGTGSFNTLILPNSGATTIRVTNLQSELCSNAISTNNTANITVYATPATPTLSPTTACQGTTPTFTASNGTYFEFLLNGVSQGAPSTTATWTPSSALTAGSVILVKSFASLSVLTCFSQTSITVGANHTLTLTSSASTTNQTVCAGVSITPITYSVGGGATNASVSGLPTGVSGSFAAGMITISGTPTTAGTYSYTVTTSGNSCTVATATGTITVSPGAPSVPGAITGTAIVCASTSGLVYTIAAVTNATSYTWTVPAGWTITSGQGTTSITVTSGVTGQNGNITVTAGNSCGTSATASSIAVSVIALPSQPGAISPTTSNVCQGSTLMYMVMPPPPSGVTYTWSGPAGSTILSGQGTNVISIRFGNTSGNLTVTPSNACGNGPSQTLAISVTISVPAQPGAISGVNAPCTGSTQAYSVPLVSGVNYTWTVPAGWTINSGQGTNSISVIVGNTAGNIQVIAGNACGGSAPRTLAVTPQSSSPLLPSAISGGAQVCFGSTQIYSVTNIPFVSYAWTVPVGWIINSGQGSNSISVTVGNTAGNITVTPSNECGVGPAQTKAVTVDLAIPSDPGNIIGHFDPCESSYQVYSVTAQTGVSYAWTVPTGSTITSGQGTNSISVTIGGNSGNVSVALSNSCGNGSVKTLGIVVRPLPLSAGPITGNTVFCEGTVQNYSVTNVPGLTYTWTVPNGWIINSGQGTNAINVTTNIKSGNVQVIPVNSCGPGPASILAVTVNPLPDAFVGTDKTICKGASVQLGGPAVPGNTYSWTSVPVGFVSSHSDPTVSPEENTVYTLVETNPLTGCSNSNSVTVIANQVISVTITPSSQTICTGQTTNIVVSSNISYTTFTWDPVLISGTGTSGFTSGSGPNIAQIIINNSSSASVVKYTITAMANECVNNESAVEVIINPAPVVAGGTKTICSDIPCAYTLASSTNGVAVQSYSITSIQSNGLVASAGSPSTGTGFGSNEIADDAWTNTTTAAVHVVYTIVPVSSSGCGGTPFTVDLTINPEPIVTNSATKSICSGTSTSISLTASIASNFSWTIGAITGGITGASAGSGSTINQTLTNPSSTVAGSVEYIVTPVATSGTCAGSAYSIIVTVNPKPVVTNPSTKSICSGDNTNISLVSGTPSTFSWTIGTITGGITGASAGSGSSINQVLINPSNASPGTVVYQITSTAVAGGCLGDVFNITVTVDPIPNVTVGSSPSAICPSVPFNLTSSSSLSFTPTTLLNENFNSATNTWLKENNSTGGTVANAAWTLRPNGYVYSGNTFNSNDNSQFYLSNSDAQGNGGITDTRLQTPALNTIGYSSLFLDFYHHYRHYSGSTGQVEVSTNGSAWTTVLTINTDRGSSNNFEARTVDLSAFVGNPTFYIRFRYQSNYGWYWAIDNVTVRGTVGATQPIISWVSSPVGFTSSQANIANVTQGVTTAYTVSYTNPISGCKNSATTTVTSLAPPTPTIEPDYCKVPGKIQLTATGGGTYLWSTGETTQVIVVDIAGVYSVTVTGANGCSSVANLNVSSDLVVNGNFSAGNVGFTSGYGYDPAANGLVCCESEYAVNNNAQFTHSNFWGFDKTSGTGTGTANFLIVNGAKYAPQPVVWQQTVSVVPNTDYYFAAYAISLNNVAPFAKLRFEVNGVQVGTTANLVSGVNSNANPWRPQDRFYGSWNSGAATTAVIRIIDLETAAGGNDFGIDDISFGTLSPVPFTFNPSANGGTNLVCEGQPLQLNANITGGMPPYITSWSGPNGFTSTQQNPIINTASMAAQGQYTLTMHDSYGCTDQTKSFTVTVNPAPTGTVSGGGDFCQYGASPIITFTANGGTAPYTFTYNINGGANQTISTFGTDNTTFMFAPTTSLGSYTYNLVSVVDDKGCSRDVTSSTLVVINPLPVSSISGNSPVCPGSMGNIYTGNAGMMSYDWGISGNGSISGVNNDIILDVTAGTLCNNPFELTLKVTDSKGCGAIAVETIMVDDVTNPFIHTCPADKNYIGTSVSVISPLAYSESTVIITETEFNTEGGSASDNCEIDTYSYSDVQSGTSPIVVARTFTVTDKCGNITQCIQRITILSTPPDITCAPPVSVNATNGLCSADINPQEPTINAGAPVSWSWVMSGATSASGTGSIGNYTFNVGVTTITWTATNASGTDACDQTITVIDNQKPNFSIPSDKSYCVESIILADYWDPTIDITPTRPDFYTFTAGKIDLDLVTATFTDNCPATCGFEIRWRITFEDGSTIPSAPATYNTGQISTYSANIIFPGKVTGVATHKVTYQIVDCNGNVSDEQNLYVTINPRPNVIKLN